MLFRFHTGPSSHPVRRGAFSDLAGADREVRGMAMAVNGKGEKKVKPIYGLHRRENIIIAYYLQGPRNSIIYCVKKEFTDADLALGNVRRIF